MAKYRSIHEKIWKDPDFQLYSAHNKLVFIYLFTNGATSESGIYAITPKTIADETGIDRASVIKIMNSLKNVLWDEKNNYVYVRRFRIYNGGGAPENIKKAIANEFLQSSAHPFWSYFITDYPEFKESILATGKPLNLSLFPPAPPITNTISNSNSNSIEPLVNGLPTVGQPLVGEGKPSSNGKYKYGESLNVLLLKEEYEKLIKKFGTAGATERINGLSYYIGSKGDKYKSHYSTILNWDTMDKKKGIGGSYGAKKSGVHKPGYSTSVPTHYEEPEDVFGKSSPEDPGAETTEEGSDG